MAQNWHNVFSQASEGIGKFFNDCKIIYDSKRAVHGVNMKNIIEDKIHDWKEKPSFYIDQIESLNKEISQQESENEEQKLKIKELCLMAQSEEVRKKYNLDIQNDPKIKEQYVISIEKMKEEYSDYANLPEHIKESIKSDRIKNFEQRNRLRGVEIQYKKLKDQHVNLEKELEALKDNSGKGSRGNGKINNKGPNFSSGRKC